MQAILDGDPRRSIDAILLAHGRLDDLLDRLPADVTVLHQYRLIGGVSVSTTAGVLRSLASERHVKAIEPVRDVTHC
jgi:hypothetical protein